MSPLLIRINYYVVPWLVSVKPVSKWYMAVPLWNYYVFISQFKRYKLKILKYNIDLFGWIEVWC